MMTAQNGQNLHVQELKAIHSGIETTQCVSSGNVLDDGKQTIDHVRAGGYATDEDSGCVGIARASK